MRFGVIIGLVTTVVGVNVCNYAVDPASRNCQSFSCSLSFPQYPQLHDWMCLVCHTASDRSRLVVPVAETCPIASATELLGSGRGTVLVKALDEKRCIIAQTNDPREVLVADKSSRVIVYRGPNLGQGTQLVKRDNQQRTMSVSEAVRSMAKGLFAIGLFGLVCFGLHSLTSSPPRGAIEAGREMVGQALTTGKIVAQRTGRNFMEALLAVDASKFNDVTQMVIEARR